MGEIKVVGGFIEKDYTRIAQLLPGVDERDAREALGEAYEDEKSEAYDSGYGDATQEMDDKIQEALWEFNDNIDRELDRLLKEGLITEETHTLLCERLPAP